MKKNNKQKKINKCEKSINMDFTQLAKVSSPRAKNTRPGWWREQKGNVKKCRTRGTERLSQ